MRQKQTGCNQHTGSTKELCCITPFRLIAWDSNSFPDKENKQTTHCNPLLHGSIFASQQCYFANHLLHIAARHTLSRQCFFRAGATFLGCPFLALQNECVYPIPCRYIRFMCLTNIHFTRLFPISSNFPYPNIINYFLASSAQKRKCFHPATRCAHCSFISRFTPPLQQNKTPAIAKAQRPP